VWERDIETERFGAMGKRRLITMKHALIFLAVEFIYAAVLVVSDIVPLAP